MSGQRMFAQVSNNGNLMYLDGESLLLFVPESGEVYGFKKETAALVLQIEELLRQGEKNLEKVFPNVPKNFLERVRKILVGEEKKNENISYEPPLKIGRFTERKEGVYSFYAGDRIAVHLELPDDEFVEKLLPQFTSLSSENAEVCDKEILVNLQPCGELWQMFFNGEKIGIPVAKETVPLILQENLIIAFYQARSYLMALHAGAVSINGKSVIMPGKSGSGKSTLTAALVAKGHLLYSDEIALVGYDGKLTPMPFALNIKEGSWNLLTPCFPELEKRQEHLRFDGQKVRFLQPKNLAEKESEISAIVFPTYKKGAACHLKSLSACDTLRYIKESGYQLEKSLNKEHFEKILQHLLAKPSYTLTFGNIDEAINTLEEKVFG